MGYTYTPSPLHYRHQDITFLACLHPVRNWHSSRETKINAPTYKCGSRLCGRRTANEKLRFNSKPGGTSKGTKQSAPPPERESTFDYCFHYWPSSVVKCYICLLCFIFLPRWRWLTWLRGWRTRTLNPSTKIFLTVCVVRCSVVSWPNSGAPLLLWCGVVANIARFEGLDNCLFFILEI